MNVLVTTDTVGGVWTFAVHLAHALAARGVSVTVAALGDPLSEAQRAQAAALGLTVHARTCRLEWMQEPWADVAAAGDWLREVARAGGADVVHLNGYAHAALPWHVPVVVTAHSCVLSWWRAVHGEPAPADWTRYGAEVRAGLAAADLVTFPTRALRDAMVREYGPLPRSRVIANGSPPAAAATAAARQPFVFTAGRLWDAAKNLAALRAAAATLPWPVRVAGPTRGPDGALGDGGALELLGPLPPASLRAELARAGIYAAPALYEPFGLAILEAAQTGCPLVLGDIPTLRELWDGAAVFVPPRDAAALATALHALVADAGERARLGAAARERARGYTVDRMADAYLDAYRHLHAGKRRSTAICA